VWFLYSWVTKNIEREVVILKSGEQRKMTGILKSFDTNTNTGMIETEEPITKAKSLLTLQFGEFSKKNE
jgi:small nuclear ribonucleoprotein (snRNP)-like protein